MVLLVEWRTAESEDSGSNPWARLLLLEQKPVLYHEWSIMAETHSLCLKKSLPWWSLRLGRWTATTVQKTILKLKKKKTSVAQHFYIIKKTTWSALPIEVASTRTDNFFKNSLEKQWAENPQISELIVNNHRYNDNLRVHQQSVARVLLDIDQTVCPTTTHAT